MNYEALRDLENLDQNGSFYPRKTKKGLTTKLNTGLTKDADKW